MRRALMIFAFAIACPAIAIAAAGEPRASVLPVLAVSAQSGLRAPDPACTCASTESFPAPSRYEAECTGGAVCEDLHYAEWIARKSQANTLGKLLATHYVRSRVYDATISFRARAGDSTFRVHVGDIVPTPRGPARVVQVHRSFVDNWDDGYVTLHLLAPRADDRAKIYVSSGAPSHAGGVAMTMVQASAGVANVVVVDGTTRTAAVKTGDRITTSRGALRVTGVVDGIEDGAIGWVEIESAP